MIKSRSSSQSSLPPQDSVDSACSDELMGSHSRRWLADLLDKDMSSESGDVTAVGRDGLCVDYHFPVGELEMKSGVKWKRPKRNVKQDHFHGGVSETAACGDCGICEERRGRVTLVAAAPGCTFLVKPGDVLASSLLVLALLFFLLSQVLMSKLA
ncbi:hypothetical protein GOODEAATRI_001859 [Goodea atripinnis]|uniref:Uncharacterized protein n=1 Tax=Goodea atripinnis TaxID=208336 RepID=A0ABV0MNI2_9TELE